MPREAELDSVDEQRRLGRDFSTTVTQNSEEETTDGWSSSESGTDEDASSSDCLREYLQTQCHHVSPCCPQCKSHVVCHLENPDKMYKIINVKDFQTCKDNMSVAEPRNQAEEVLSKCTSMRTTTFLFCDDI